MPFVAICNGERVTSTELNMQEARSQPKGTFRCAGCQEPMHPKRYQDTGTQFFAHYVDGGCAHGAGESRAHLYLKERVGNIARQAGWQVDYEVRIETSSGVAIIDVLLSSPDGDDRRAVEIQLSSQSSDAYIERTEAYREHGIDTLWLRRHKKAPPGKVKTLRLRTDGRTGQDISDYIHHDIKVDVNRVTPTRHYLAKVPLETFLRHWLRERIVYRLSVTFNPRVRPGRQACSFIVEVTSINRAWLTPRDAETLEKEYHDAKLNAESRQQEMVKWNAEESARQDAAMRQYLQQKAKAEREQQRQLDYDIARIAREHTAQRRDKQQQHDQQEREDMQSTLERMPHAPAPKGVIAQWLEMPIPEELCETLDRLTIIYNEGVANGTIIPPT